ERKTDALGRIEHFEREQLGLIEGVTGGRDRVEEATAALTEARVRAAELGERRAAAEGRVTALGASERELGERIAKIAADSAEGQERATQLRAQADELAGGLDAVRDERRALAEQLDSGRSAYQLQMAELEVADVQVRELRARAERLASEANNLELRLGNLAMSRQALQESMHERHGLDIARNLGDYHLRPQVTGSEDKRLSELRRLITRMGSDINLTAIDEFSEVSERHDFLSTQQGDLESAVDQLEKAIAKINRTSRKLFRDTYVAIDRQFRELFPRLFRGGQARLALVPPRGHEAGTELDILDAGVEVVAQPPGKKNTTVDQLSGGEKALTAVALIFSIFLIKPSPFCLLDEVDA
ncbi:MAG: chromosome segregation protein SMC, partial [Myxococcota bacterium]